MYLAVEEKFDPALWILHSSSATTGGVAALDFCKML